MQNKIPTLDTSPTRISAQKEKNRFCSFIDLILLNKGTIAEPWASPKEILDKSQKYQRVIKNIFAKKSD